MAVSEETLVRGGTDAVGSESAANRRDSRQPIAGQSAAHAVHGTFLPARHQTRNSTVASSVGPSPKWSWRVSSQRLPLPPLVAASTTGDTLTTSHRAPERQYVAIAAYFFSPQAGQTPPDSGFAVLPLEDAITNDATTATALRVVAVHVSGDVPSVDVGVLAGTTFSPMFTNVPRGANSSAAGTTVPAERIAPASRTGGSPMLPCWQFGRAIATRGSTPHIAARALPALTARAMDRVSAGMESSNPTIRRLTGATIEPCKMAR